MKSKAQLKSHPLHPILIGFPIAFFIGALVFDALGYAQNNEALWQTGRYLDLAGVVTGLLAAVPGIVDYFAVVPPASSAKKRATKHGVLNVVVVLLFAAVWLYRRDEAAAPGVVLALELVGVVLLGISGWLGGTLVHRNQIGVDHRYAGAGKWKETHLAHHEGAVEVAGAGELKAGQMMLVHVGGKRIVVGRTDEGYRAFDDHCTHRGGSLADGALVCDVVQCPWHGSQFNVTTGAVKAGPAKAPIKTYDLKQEGAKVFLVM